jgi:hypothetical protein
LTYRLEGLDLGLLGRVVQGILHVVHGDTTLTAADLRQLRHTLECTILCSEIENGCPIVGEVLGE